MTMKPDWLLIPAIIIPAGIMAPAYAVQYLTTEQAQKALFPAVDSFASTPVKLDDEQKKFVEKAAGVKMRFNEQPVWKVLDGGNHVGWFVLDEVYGKHEFITYAVALGLDGAVRGVEILDYRETHGGEVKNTKWRAQFNGKKLADPLKLDEDIQNISGATLSCHHVTDGVKRILAIHEIALKGQR
jgi:Na+-transporting NADH:ubiquinone oxidoreductase subunit C